jgi:hypothetical protein
VGPFGLSNGAFDSYMIYFSIVIFAPPLGVQVGVGTFGNCENCSRDGKVSVCYGDSWIGGGGGGDGLALVLT